MFFLFCMVFPGFYFKLQHKKGANIAVMVAVVKSSQQSVIEWRNQLGIPQICLHLGATCCIFLPPLVLQTHQTLIGNN